MRYSKDHKAETRERIVRNASVRLRERGAEGIGVADLMKEAGLTHGGFYAHFESKDALIDEAFAFALSQIAARWRKRAENAPPGEGLEAIVNGYLTEKHRDDVGHGCVLPALGAEIARGDAKSRRQFVGVLDDMIEAVAAQIALPPKAARRRAIAIISTMMGSMILARAAGSGDLSDDILDAGRRAALGADEVTSSRGGAKAR